MLKNLDVIDDENLDVWNVMDEGQEPDAKKHISYIKMINEINQRGARYKDEDGKMKEFGLCSSGPGTHSSKRSWRTGNLDVLGPGIILYLKMLKYFACWFFVFTILSLPIVIIFGSGSAFKDQRAIAALVGRSSLGNLGIYENYECAYNNIEGLTGADKTMTIKFACTGDSHDTMDRIQSLGLSYREQTCTGLGMEMSVKTVARCSYGSSASIDEAIEAAFDEHCKDQSSCDLKIDLDVMF